MKRPIYILQNKSGLLWSVLSVALRLEVGTAHRCDEEETSRVDK